MKKANIQLETLACPSCLLKIENSLKRLNGVDKESIKVMYNSSRARLDFNEEIVSITQIEEAITKLGYNVIKSSVR